MPTVEPFADAPLESLARFLGECGTGSTIVRVFHDQGIVDRSGESTKWKRLDWASREMQRADGSANRVLKFIASYLAPSRFVGVEEQFEACRRGHNQRLSFAGFEYGVDGQFRQVTKASTLSEAEARADAIQAKFRGRRLHPEVLKYCRPELMQENYFHAVFEATKGLAQRIREMSGVDADGAKLVDSALLGKNPRLAMNSLHTETERSEQNGFGMLLKGCFGAIRNPLAHKPKILWEGEDDAADYLTMISLLHRKLDDCVPVPPANDSE